MERKTIEKVSDKIDFQFILDILKDLTKEDLDWFSQVRKDDTIFIDKATNKFSQRCENFDKVKSSIGRMQKDYYYKKINEFEFSDIDKKDNISYENVPTLSRDIEMQWIKENNKAISEFKNEWIVIEGRNLISHSKKYSDAIDKAKKQGIEIPFIIYIPAEEHPYVNI